MESWFGPASPPVEIASLEIIRRAGERIPGVLNTESYTLLSDLTQSEDVIFSGISKDSRYEIKRSEAKDVAACTITQNPTPADIQSFVKSLNDLYAQKGLNELSLSSGVALERYRSAGCIRLTRVEADGEILASHCYFSVNSRCRLLYSISSFRDKDTAQARARVGRANRFLHWRDMLYFKQQGVETYDWGGWRANADETLHRINKFKEEFGGIKVPIYDAVRPITFFARVAVRVSGLVRR